MPTNNSSYRRELTVIQLSAKKKERRYKQKKCKQTALLIQTIPWPSLLLTILLANPSAHLKLSFKFGTARRVECLQQKIYLSKVTKIRDV